MRSRPDPTELRGFAAIIGGVEIPAEWASEDFCYVTTVGRRTGAPHTIEIWFVLDGGTFYLMSGGGDRSDWVRNMRKEPNVTVRVAEASFPARARIVDGDGDDGRIRRSMAAKYQGWHEGAELSSWAQTALLVALEPN